MKCGIDLLIVSPDGEQCAERDLWRRFFEEIPIVVVGVEPQTKAYTTVIQADDNGIGKMAGEYILRIFIQRVIRLSCFRAWKARLYQRTDFAVLQKQ